MELKFQAFQAYRCWGNRLALSKQEVKAAADALLKDGVSLGSVSQFSGLGVNADDRNISRNFDRLIRRSGVLDDLTPYVEKIPIKRAGCLPELYDFNMLLPHDLLHLAYLANPEEFRQHWNPGGADELRTFWRNCETNTRVICRK